MKWRQNEWNQNRLTFDKADAAMQILKDNGFVIYMHELCEEICTLYVLVIF